MKREEISREAATASLREHKEHGLHVDSRLLREIDQPGQVALLILETENEFLDLVWQAVPATRPLTPQGHPRSLRDCASRLASVGWSFEALVEAGYPWFQTCNIIDRAFDIDKVGCVAVTPLVATEAQDTPHGTYYVYDGVHKSIVLAKRLLRREVQYAPMKALLLEPRRH